MEPNTLPPTGGRRGNPIIGWAKRNKAAAAAIGAGAVFVVAQQRGKDGEGGEIAEGDTAATADGMLVPVAAGSADSATSAYDYILDRAEQDRETATERTDQAIEEAKSTAEVKHDDAQAAAERAAENPPAVAPPPPSPASPTNTGGGITIMGHFFSGATAQQSVGSGKNSHGSYVTHLITFPGRTERWRRYNHGPKGKPINKWEKVSSASNPTASNPDHRGGAQAPTPPPAATPPPPRPAPAPPPAAAVPAGYTAGGNVGYRGKNFGGAIGWRKVNNDVPAGSSKYDGYLVHYANHNESWRYYVSGPRKGEWQKVG